MKIIDKQDILLILAVIVFTAAFAFFLYSLINIVLSNIIADSNL